MDNNNNNNIPQQDPMNNQPQEQQPVYQQPPMNTQPPMGPMKGIPTRVKRLPRLFWVLSVLQSHGLLALAQL